MSVAFASYEEYELSLHEGRQRPFQICMDSINRFKSPPCSTASMRHLVDRNSNELSARKCGNCYALDEAARRRASHSPL